MASFTEQLRQNLATLQSWLTAWVEELIHKNRPMWLDDGTPVGRGSIINYSGTVEKVGEQINLSGGSGSAAHDIEGASHTAAGLTAGDVLLAESDTTFGFGPITDGMIPATIARDTEVTTALSTHAADASPHPSMHHHSLLGLADNDHNQNLLTSVLDQAGDLLVGSADNVAVRLGVGLSGQVLTGDTTVTPYKMKWAYPKTVTYIPFGSESEVYVPS